MSATLMLGARLLFLLLHIARAGRKTIAADLIALVATLGSLRIAVVEALLYWLMQFLR